MSNRILIILALCLVPIPIIAGGDVTGVWTLDRSLSQLRQSNPDARSAAIRIEKARAQLAEARAQLWPKVFAETGYAATDNPVNAFMMQLNQRQFGFGSNFNDPDTTDNWASELRMEYLFYTGGARRAAIESAKFGLEASEYEKSATVAQLELEVARAWFQIYQSGEIVKAAKASLESQQSNLKLAHHRVDAATALQTDVLDIETKVLESEANLAYADNSKLIAIAFLKALLGLDENVSFRVTDGLTAIVEPGQGSSERSELSALKMRAKQARSGVDRAKAERLPVVSGFASGRHDEGFIERGAGDSWMVGLMVRLKVWGGGETKAKIEQAEKEVDLVLEQQRKQSLAIALQVKSARLNLQTARKRIEFAEKGILRAGESLRLTRKRFKEGLALSAQLIDGESALTGSRVRLAKAEAEEQLALASLRTALGLPIQNSSQENPAKRQDLK